MMAEPNKPQYAASIAPHKHRMNNLFSRSPKDPEKGSSPKTKSSASRDKLLDMNHYNIIDEIWHYSSIDFDKHYVCVGYNSVHTVPIDPEEGDATVKARPSSRPSGKRSWCWVMLCDDQTVITLHEDPYHGRTTLSDVQKETLHILRQHFMRIFRAIVAPINDADHTHSQNPLVILPLRRTFDDAATPSSLLFHYIFDDWAASYALVARKEYMYGTKLDEIRLKMLRAADIKDIEDLHRIGRQLAVLKKVYESYARIIDHLLEQQDFSFRIAPDAVTRFRRLHDRITLYALGELQDCLGEKADLVMMTFNLIANKESQAVERLTRTTIFLAKVTILFLPATLMTGYFSIQARGVSEYSTTVYWVTFGVVVGLSLIALILFGIITGTVEGYTIYKGFTTLFVEGFGRVTHLTVTQRRPVEKDE